MTISNKQFYSPGQRKAIEKLRPILQLATSSVRPDLSLSTRTNTLVAGPSGSGKSFLAKALAAEAGLPIWETNVSTWIVLGARNGNPTLVSLFEWINRMPKGVIFLDELEKPFPYNAGGSSSGSSDWFNSVRMEIHDLLDARMPDAAIQVDEAAMADSYDGMLSTRDCKDLLKFSVEMKLRNSFLIIGAGTWQHLWTTNQNTIGYNSDLKPTTMLDQGQIMRSISPEILLRFRNEVLFLPPMTESDFHQVLRDRLGQIPVNYRKRFAELVHRAIPRAMEFGLGMRIIEETFTNLCVEILRNCAGDENLFRDIFSSCRNDKIF